MIERGTLRELLAKGIGWDSLSSFPEDVEREATIRGNIFGVIW